MAFIQQERTSTSSSLRGRTLAERLLALEKKEKLVERAEITQERT